MSPSHHESPKPHTSTDPVVRVASTALDRDRVFRFRYENFANEYGRWPEPRLVSRKMIHDQVDDRALLYVAEAGGRVVATLRLRFGRLPDELAGPFDAARYVAAENQVVGLADEILVSRIYRKAALLETLIETAVSRCAESRVFLLFCHARPDAVPEFHAAGFQGVAPTFQHPYLGRRQPLVRFIGTPVV